MCVIDAHCNSEIGIASAPAPTNIPCAMSLGRSASPPPSVGLRGLTRVVPPPVAEKLWRAAVAAATIFGALECQDLTTPASASW